MTIDFEQLEELCGFQCTLEEIASFFKCSVDTIERAVKREMKMGFAEYRDKKALAGNVSLRRRQFELAMKGDRTMLIWLGKQKLGQTDGGDRAEKAVEEQLGPRRFEVEIIGTGGKVVSLENLAAQMARFYDQPPPPAALLPHANEPDEE